MLLEEKRFLSTKNEIARSLDELDWCLNVRAGLEKEGIPVEDISLLPRLVSRLKNIEVILTYFKL